MKETLQSQQRGRKCGEETHTGSVASFMVGLRRSYNIRAGQGVSRSDPTHYHSGRLIWAVITCDFQTSQTEHVHTQLPKRACEVNETRVSQAAAHFFFCLLACMEKKTFCVCVCVTESIWLSGQRSKSPKNHTTTALFNHQQFILISVSFNGGFSFSLSPNAYSQGGCRLTAEVLLLYRTV